MRPRIIPNDLFRTECVVRQVDRIVQLAEQRERHRDTMQRAPAVPMSLTTKERIARDGEHGLLPQADT
ncbi:hypothetical protein WK67_08045 [Burkholderia ubonensis]|uniref:Uncharacterized protein n=1 Tax=Burkholderia ubonensis TaxID=101571 RepID=A0AAU8UB09_9BURK|nr:hypothetical protein WK67_08045 [Burkholderia ubonensis]